MQHPDEGTVHAWLDGALPAVEAERIERHVADCASCAAMVAGARGLIAGAAGIVASLDVVRGGVIPRNSVVATRPGSLWRTLRVTPVRAAIAASLLIAAATMLSLRHDTEDKIVPRSPSVATTLAPPPVTPLVTPPVTPPMSTAAPTAAAVKDIPPRRSVADAAAPVPTAPAAPAAVVAASTTMDSVAPARDKLAEAVVESAASPQAGAQRRNFARTMKLQDVSGLAASSRSFVGCYRLPSDTVTWLRSLPERFALQQSGGASGSTNVVRAVAADGRVDSVVAGSTWLQVAPQLARVNFSVADRREAVTLQLASSGVVTARPAGGGTPAVNVVQTDCRR